MDHLAIKVWYHRTELGEFQGGGDVRMVAESKAFLCRNARQRSAGDGFFGGGSGREDGGRSCSSRAIVTISARHSSFDLRYSHVMKPTNRTGRQLALYQENEAGLPRALLPYTPTVKLEFNALRRA